MNQSTLARFFAKVRMSNRCWIWTGGCTSKGYGSFRLDGRDRPAHVASWIIHFGKIPKGMQVDHTCHNRSRSCKGGVTCKHRKCVNPAHLRLTTARENVLSGKGLAAQGARKTHCKQGHPLFGDNLYIKPDGARACRTCRYAAHKKWLARQAA